MVDPYPLFPYLGVLPVRIRTAKTSGYTLRAYVEDDDRYESGRPIFLGRDSVVFAFRSTANLVDFLRGGESHDLLDMPDWDPPDWDEVKLVADIGLTYADHEGMDVCRLDTIAGRLRSRASMVDLDGEEHFYEHAAVLDYPLEAITELLRTAQVVREIADHVALAEVLEATAPDAPLTRFEHEMATYHFTKSRQRERLSGYDMDAIATSWDAIAARVTAAIEFRG